MRGILASVQDAISSAEIPQPVRPLLLTAAE